jgi:serine/threonine protein kinase
MRYIHQNGIIHADVGCHNIILVQNYLKIIDFEGCSINSEEATSYYKWFSYQESTLVISQKTNIFAYGYTIYEIITGRPLHHELIISDDRRRLVKRLYAENRFPKVIDLSLGELMQDC